MNHTDRQLAMFKDKRDGAHRSWERVYENYKNGCATKEDLIAAMDICNCTDKAYNSMKLKAEHSYRRTYNNSTDRV